MRDETSVRRQLTNLLIIACNENFPIDHTLEDDSKASVGKRQQHTDHQQFEILQQRRKPERNGGKKKKRKKLAILSTQNCYTKLLLYVNNHQHNCFLYRIILIYYHAFLSPHWLHHSSHLRPLHYLEQAQNKVRIYDYKIITQIQKCNICRHLWVKS